MLNTVDPAANTSPHHFNASTDGTYASDLLMVMYILKL